MNTKDNRVLNYQDINNMAKDIQDARKNMINIVERALAETQLFSRDATLCLGEASFSEVRDAIIECFRDGMYKK